MNLHIPSLPAQGILAVILAFGAGGASGQETQRQISAADGAVTVMAMAEVDDLLKMTVGYSKLLQTDQSLGTIIVGDDTIAKATIGAGNSIIVTGLAAGSTNLIVLGESQEVLMSSSIAVSPVAGPLRSTVNVMKGSTTHERYECRGANCTLIDPQDQPTELSFLLTPAGGPVSSGDD